MPPRYRSDLNTPRFGSEADVETITGISRRTLQKNRLLGRGFKFYKFGRKVLYDLDEVDQTIRATASTAPTLESSRGPASTALTLESSRHLVARPQSRSTRQRAR
jgi:hypothetical protein